MKKYLGITFILLFSFNIQAQEFKTSKDSIEYFYDDLFKVMKNGYLFKDTVNWKEVESKIDKKLMPYSDFNKSLNEVSYFFDLTKADHSRLFYKDKQFSGNFQGPTQDDFTEQWIKKYKTNPQFEVKILDNQYGYILMPAMYNEKNLHKQSQRLYDEINNIKNSNKLQGWIIDLRFNTGGDIFPMLLALYDFLGDNVVWGTLDIDKNQTSEIRLKDGKYKDNSKTVSYIKPNGELLDKIKVAVITNIATGSSGEITALAFKGRENTIFIGEKTYGKTTSNVRADLPFGAFMTLTTGYDCDRNGNYYENIIPDVNVVENDNFEDLLLDGNIQEALKFISEQE